MILVPLLVVETVPGYLMRVQVPVAGNPLNATLPVAVEQVGCVMVPTMGAGGVAGCALITAFSDATDVQVAALVTVKV